VPCPPFVGSPVGVLLDLLPRRGAQRLLYLRLGAERDHTRADDRDPGLGQPRVGGQPVQDPVPDPAGTVSEQAGQRPAGDHVKHLLLRGLGQQPGDLLQRRPAPPAAVGVDGKVEPGAGSGRVGEPERDARLHRQVLEVGGAGMTPAGRHARSAGV
jgi:hypothetical protein